MKDIISILKEYVDLNPNKIAYRFLKNNSQQILEISYLTLFAQSCNIAHNLLEQSSSNSRVLILLHPGIEYIYSFLGCILAKLIAVPANPPRNNLHINRLTVLINNAKPEVIIVDDQVLQIIERNKEQLPNLNKVKIISINQLNSKAIYSNHSLRSLTNNQIAFLQYTSGSTNNPKGVKVSYENLITNLESMKQKFNINLNDQMVSWLPPYHDMGLILGILEPLYAGIPATLMSPTSFIQNPILWLKAISDYQATISPAPDFAYRYCVEQLNENSYRHYNLSSWRIAVNGAEPVQAKTLKSFYLKFKEIGFKYNSFCSCYGLAEATLMVTGSNVEHTPTIQFFDNDLLNDYKVKTLEGDNLYSKELVSCGTVISDHKIIIINPNTNKRSDCNEVGEICISGPSVTSGYWNANNNSKSTIHLEYEKQPFFKTGDLGFILNNEVYLAGRIKDIIIINGKNYYPQDIESAIVNCHPAINNNSIAAFGITIKDEEVLAILIEIKRTYRKLINSDIFNAVKYQIALKIGLSVHSIALIKPGRILKTTSGKIQRSACKKAFIKQDIELLMVYTNFEYQDQDEGYEVKYLQSAHNSQDSSNLLKDKIIFFLSKLLNKEISLGNLKHTFYYLGMDSMQIAKLINFIDNTLGVSLDITLFSDKFTIAMLIRHIEDHSSHSQ